MTQRVFLGEKSVYQLTPFLQELSPKKIVIVRGKKSYFTNGAKQMIDNLLNKNNFRILEFYDFTENPKEEDVFRGLQLLNDFCPDLIIGIGGGSVLDMSKLIRFYYSYSFHESKIRELIPLINIPTTAGTGSEATHFAVMYKNKVKFSIAHKDMLSDIAIIDPVFTYHNPIYLTASTGFDALAQGIEAYWNVYATEESDLFAIKAIHLLWENLPLLVQNGDNKLIRNKVAEGAFWSGKAINITKTTGPHALSYTFTSYYHIPHGHAVAYTFPFFFDFNTRLSNNPKYMEKMNKLFKIINFPPMCDRKNFMYKYLQDLSLSLSLPNNFDCSLILSTINTERLKNNPGISDVDKLKESLMSYFRWLYYKGTK